MKKYGIFLIIMAMMAFSVSCTMQNGNKPSPEADPLLSHIDSTVNPGDDFFMYANGKWFKDHPIPSSEQGNGLWQLIRDTINSQILSICQSSVSKDYAKGSNKQKIGDFYFSGMDSLSLNRQGIKPLMNELSRIDSISNLNDLIKEVAYIHQVSSSPLFGFYVAQDDRISSKYAIYIAQGGLSLPDRSYYLDQTDRAKMVRKRFLEYSKSLYTTMGYDERDASIAADGLLNLETALATASRKREDTRDPFKNYHKLSLGQLSKQTANINWALLFKSVGLNMVDSVVVGQPEFLDAVNTYLKSYSLKDWKNYLKFQFVNGLSDFLDDSTYMKSFRFYLTTLRGIEEPKPRWKRVVGETDKQLGELIGQVYVAEYLPKGTKEKLLEIGNAIKVVYADRIKNLDWMSEATKVKALKKLDAVIMKVGYPDHWKDLSNMEIDRTSYVKNVMHANLWQSNFMFAKYGKPVDRTEWDMEPQWYNAYYNPSNNEIVVPGCNILVPGFEHKLADDAILYAIIGGSTFGHEITHGFDDQGCKYDEYGNLNNWWTSEDRARFLKKTKMIVEQFNGYVPVDNLHINGDMTQGENIADLGGIVMGYEAFKKTSQYKNNEIIAGLTPDKRFFLAYAMAWMINDRPEAIANQVLSDVHSPAKYRVLGPLSNMPAFYKAFNVKEGQAMWRPDSLRVKIW
ncbi:MAG TPA: M13 family metallopeptidase [Williamwhitmania sp.]|nr:M13 family metallopeptidase [Williamwhitmania sp.]